MLEFDDDLAYEHGTLNMSDLGHRYLWGPAVDELLADENASSNVITWPLPDHLGTIRDWVNNSGTNLDHVEYDTAGRRLDTAAIDEVFGRAGLFHDKYTGNDYARNRWTDPETGRWLSQDPIGFNGGSFSLYVYAGNAATVATDPSGLIRIFGEQWTWPWSRDAAGFSGTMGAYGRSLGRAVTGTASGAVAGAGTGAISGAAVGAGVGVCAGGVGAGPGAVAGAGAGAVGGATWGGISGLIDAAFAEEDQGFVDTAKRGARSGAIGGAFGGAGKAYGAVRALGTAATGSSTLVFDATTQSWRSELVPVLVEKVVTPSPGGYIPGMSFSLTEGVHHHVTKLSEIVSCSQVN